MLPCWGGNGRQTRNSCLGCVWARHYATKQTILITNRIKWPKPICSPLRPFSSLSVCKSSPLQQRKRLRRKKERANPASNAHLTSPLHHGIRIQRRRPHQSSSLPCLLHAIFLLQPFLALFIEHQQGIHSNITTTVFFLLFSRHQRPSPLRRRTRNSPSIALLLLPQPDQQLRIRRGAAPDGGHQEHAFERADGRPQPQLERRARLRGAGL